MSTLQPRVSTRARQANSPSIVATTNSREAATTWSALSQDIPVRSSPPPDTDEPMASRSNSVSNMDEATPQTESRVNGTERSITRKDKGKGKEKEKGAANGKSAEEPLAITYNLNEFGPPQVRIVTLFFLVIVAEVACHKANEDYCSSCQSFGSLVYCDGCPRAFHLWCLDPPMEPQDLPEGEKRWFCPACAIQRVNQSDFCHYCGVKPQSARSRLRDPPLRPGSSHLCSSNWPVVYPPNFVYRKRFVRTSKTVLTPSWNLFSRLIAFSVGTSAKGAYVDTSKIKPPRLKYETLHSVIIDAKV